LSSSRQSSSANRITSADLTDPEGIPALTFGCCPASWFVILVSIVIPGRVEARMTVPAGGASVTATVVNGGAAALDTVAAASYFLTESGGIPGLVATLESQLNCSHDLMDLHRSASVMAPVAGGNRTDGSGWLWQEASSNRAPVFGAVS